MSNEAAEILRRAKARIEDPEHWCRDAYAKTAKRGGAPCAPTAPDATAWCAAGSLRAQGNWDCWSPRSAGWWLMIAAEPSAPAIINDRRGHRAVMELYDRAIALAEAEGTPWTPPTERRNPRGWAPKVMAVDGVPGVWLVESQSKPLTFHTVRSVGTGFANCDCEAAIYQPNKVCFHIRTAIHAAAQAAPEEGEG